MNKRLRTAKFLIGFGCVVILVGSILHLAAGYPQVSAAIAASNLTADFKEAMRAVFLMIGWTWIVIAVIALIAAFNATRISKALVLFSGFALLLQIPIWVGIMGWFLGNEMFVAAGGLIVFGGLLLRPVPRRPLILDD